MKTKSIQLFLVLFCLTLSLSCEKEEQFIRSEESIKTVSLDQALDIMKQTQQDILAKSDSNFITSISEEVNYEDLTNTDEELAVIPVTTQYSKLNSRLVLLTIDGKVQSAVVSLNPFENSTPSSFSGELLITDMEGDFIKAFKIENNVFVSEYVNNNSKSKESDKLENHNTPKDTGGSCRCVFSVCDYCQLEEVVIVVESTPPRIPTPYISITHMYNTDGSGGETSANEWDLGASGPGYTDNTPEPEADKPCPGDPVPNPEIAPQKGKSGILGAMFGNSTIGGCKRYGSDHCTTPRNRQHNGIDIKNEIGEPVYSMYSGLIYSTGYSDDFGYYANIQTTINGQTFIVTHAHLQKENRILQENVTSVDTGDILGYQGDTGNIKTAIDKGMVEPHVHIEVRDHDNGNSWNYDKNFNNVDPRNYLTTTIDDNGDTGNTSNCN